MGDFLREVFQKHRNQASLLDFFTLSSNWCLYFSYFSSVKLCDKSSDFGKAKDHGWVIILSAVGADDPLFWAHNRFG